MSKPFFYRLNAADFFAVVRNIPNKDCAKWLRTFASDLVSGESQDNYTLSLIEEAKKFRENKSLAGKKGMETRYQRSNTVITELQQNDNTDITNSSNSNSNSNNTKTIKEEREKKKRFVPPSIEEVTAYCLERNNQVDPEKFFDHYETRNWIPKGYTKQMTNWKAAVRTWEKNTAQNIIGTINRTKTFRDLEDERNMEERRKFLEWGQNGASGL